MGAHWPMSVVVAEATPLTPNSVEPEECGAGGLLRQHELGVVVVGESAALPAEWGWTCSWACAWI